MNKGNICVNKVFITSKDCNGFDNNYVYVYSVQEKLNDCQITDIKLLNNRKIVDTVIAGNVAFFEYPCEDYYRISFYNDRMFSVEIKRNGYYEFSDQLLGADFHFCYSMVYFEGKLINIIKNKSVIIKNFNKIIFNVVADKFKKYDILNYSDILAQIEDQIYH